MHQIEGPLIKHYNGTRLPRLGRRLRVSPQNSMFGSEVAASPSNLEGCCRAEESPLGVRVGVCHQHCPHFQQQQR